jgi:acyl carrier protein
MEQAIAEVWCEVLRRPSLQSGEHFFDLGGNSMSAIRIISRINSACGSSLTTQDLYDNPSVQELAAAVRRYRRPETVL